MANYIIDEDVWQDVRRAMSTRYIKDAIIHGGFVSLLVNIGSKQECSTYTISKKRIAPYNIEVLPAPNGFSSVWEIVAYIVSNTILSSVCLNLVVVGGEGTQDQDQLLLHRDVLQNILLTYGDRSVDGTKLHNILLTYGDRSRG